MSPKNSYIDSAISIDTSAMISTFIEGYIGECSWFFQDDWNNRYINHIEFYGGPLGADINPFTVDPQVGFERCYNANSGYRLPPKLPDYVVWVYLSFDYKDEQGRAQTGLFSKRFLSDIKVITRDDLKNTWSGKINDYATKAKNNTAVQTLPGGVSVTHPNMDKMMFKIQKVIEKL